MRMLSAITLGLTVIGAASANVAAVSNYGKLPLSFEPNRGQAASGTQYVARGSGYLLSLEPTGSRILLRTRNKSAQISSQLVGAAAHPRLEALDPLPGHSSYFRGNDPSKWVTNIPNYGKIRAAGVYPGIDLIYYGNQSRLEYDFVLNPGADPAAIRMRFDGASSLRNDADGNLVLATPAGEIVQQKPVIYQTIGGERRPVAGRFVLHGRRTVAFELAAYDRSQSLVIDPVLVYNSFLGGSDHDEGHSVAADIAGNLYLTGVTYSTLEGDADVFIRKIAPDGSAFLYNADMGGSADDIGNGIAVDPSGSVYVGGYSTSPDFPLLNAFQNVNVGNTNAIVLRLDPTGAPIFSTYIGGSYDDYGNAIALDTQGNVYLAGGTDSPDFPTSSGAYQTQLKGNSDCFIVKFDSQGNGIFSTLIGGGSDNQAFGIGVDAHGNSYITGQTDSDSYPQVNPPFQHSRHGGLDAFVTELSSDGSHLVYSTFAGGSGADSGGGIAVDPAGNAYVVGTTASSDFPTSNGSYQSGYAGGVSDIFVQGYSVNGQSLQFSTLLGSHGTDEGNGIALDSADNVYVTGDSNSDQYPVTSGAVQPNRKAGFDIILSILNPAGTQLLYSTFLGGSGDDSGYGVATDPYGNAYLTGVTSSFDYPTTPGVVQPQAGGGDTDAIFAKIGFANPTNAPQVFTASVAAPGIENTVNPFHRGIVPNHIAGKFTTSEARRSRKNVKSNRVEESRFRRYNFRAATVEQ
jgi:Beta-propeller repeat